MIGTIYRTTTIYTNIITTKIDTMTTIQLQVLDTLNSLGYNDVRALDNIGSLSFIMEARGGNEHTAVISLLEECSHTLEYMRTTIGNIQKLGYRAIIFVARNRSIIELFDAYDFHSQFPELTYTWMILTDN